MLATAKHSGLCSFFLQSLLFLLEAVEEEHIIAHDLPTAQIKDLKNMLIQSSLLPPDIIVQHQQAVPAFQAFVAPGFACQATYRSLFVISGSLQPERETRGSTHG